MTEDAQDRRTLAAVGGPSSSTKRVRALRETSASLTPRKRVETVLRGGHVDRVPFTIYESMVPQCTVERELRNRGMCIVHRNVNVFRTHRPNVQVTQEIFREDDRQLKRTIYRTPVGTLSTLEEPVGFTSWVHRKMFKSPDDYKALRFFLSDEQYEPNYEAFAEAQEAMGQDVILRAGFGLEPLQTLISSNLMSTEDFCFQWMDRRDEVLALYEILVEKRRRVYPLVAASPALHANYGGNVVPAIVGPENFRRYYVPHYNEAAEVMHRHGKLIGSHLDADCGPIASDVAESDLDYVEAFTPAPDTDMTLAQARAAWPRKVLWLNFPSSLHLAPDADVAAATVAMLAELDRVDGLIMGITENIPPHRRLDSCRAIMDGLDRHVRACPGLYR